jgi:integrase
MPSHNKGKKVEPGIWEMLEGKGYIAEVSWSDPETGRRVREMKTTNRIDDAQDWRMGRKVDALRHDIRRTKKQEVVLFEDFADEYYEAWKLERKPTTIYSEQRRIETVLKPYFGQQPIHTITRKDVERYMAYRRERGRIRKKKGDSESGVTAATVNRELCRLKNMFKKAVAWGYVESNPAEGITQAREQMAPADYLRVKEVNKLLMVCDDYARPLFTMALYTGMRWGELMALQWKDVDFERSLITVRDPKNMEPRHIPLNGTVKDVLSSHQQEQAKQVGGIVKQVFLNTKTGKAYNDLRKALSRGLKAAGVTRHIRFHDLRHTAASHLAMAGVDLRTVGAVLGHKDPKMTLRYAHLAPEHLKEAMEKLDYGVAKVDQETGEKKSS